MADDNDTVTETRVAALKRAFMRVVAKREKRVIDRLVGEHIEGSLTPDKAFAAIMVIAELRHAGSDVRAEDL
jgi:hypothetical protein